MVYQEIMSYIKGSKEALEYSKNAGRKVGALELDEYLEVGRKRAPNFDHSQRPKVYQLYEKYQKVRYEMMNIARKGR